MPKTRQAVTPQAREQRRAEQRELVRASIEILSQHPTAEPVAGFRAWLELGYCVTKGSTGIRV